MAGFPLASKKCLVYCRCGALCGKPPNWAKVPNAPGQYTAVCSICNKIRYAWLQKGRVVMEEHKND